MVVILTMGNTSSNPETASSEDYLKPIHGGHGLKPLVVGEGTLELNKLAKEIENSTSFVVLIQKWKYFGQSLGVNDIKMVELGRKLNHDDTELVTIPREILMTWKAEKGTGATFDILCDTLTTCGVRDIADSLIAKFTSFREEHGAKFNLQGELLRLDELLDKNTPQEIINELSRHLEENFRSNPFQIQMVKKGLCPPYQPKHYIKRTLFYVSENEIDSKIFSKSLKNHVFLLQGTSKSELAKLTGYKPIEQSGNQLENVTAGFILLDCDEDYDKIISITTKPVHLIRREGKRYIWIKSSGEIHVIKSFLRTEKGNIDEATIAATISSKPPPCAFIIADLPGMGKTLLLASLASNIRKRNPVALHLFIVLQEFAKQLAVMQSNMSPLEAIASYAAQDDIKKPVMLELLRHIGKLYLYLDGFDEVQQANQDLIERFLKQASKLKNAIVIVTTRLHEKTTLENIFNQIAHDILPFDLTTQIQFLTTNWISQCGACRCERLERFARLCLEVLTTKMNDKEKQIAGIPLQCKMLAEVYAEFAVRACKIKNAIDEVVIHHITFFKMYKQLVHLKFKRVKDSIHTEKYKLAHIYQALALLFPKWIYIFKPILKGYDEVDDSTMYSIGLIDHYGGSTPRFIHQTFAEFLLAEFIVNNLGRHGECADLLFADILGKRGSKNNPDLQKNEIPCYVMNYSVIAYFIEMHMKEFAENQNISWPFPSIEQKKEFRANVFKAAQACCSNDMEHTFDYVKRVLDRCPLTSPKWKKLVDKCFKELPLVVVHNTNNLKLLEKVVAFATRFSIDMSYHANEKVCHFNGIEIANLSPLHVAVTQGKYNMVTWLVEQYNTLQGHFQTDKLKCLLHLCLNQSEENSDSVIDDKLLIIDLLFHGYRRSHKAALCYNPQLIKNVHCKLFERLSSWVTFEVVENQSGSLGGMERGNNKWQKQDCWLMVASQTLKLFLAILIGVYFQGIHM